MTIRGGGSPQDVEHEAILIATVLPRKGTVGVQTHVSQVADVLRGQGRRVRVVDPTSWLPLLGPALLLPGRFLRRAGLEVGVRLDRYWHRRLLQSALARELVRGRPAVVYAQDPRSAYAAIRARGRLPVAVVMAVHYNVSQAQELVDRGLIAPGGSTDKAIRDFEAALVPALDGIVFLSEYMQRRLQDDIPGMSHVPSAVIPNFLGAASPGSDREEATRDCISVGTLFERKNHRYLLRVLAAASRQGRRYTLTLVGDGPQREALQRLAADLGIADQVVFTGARFDVDRLLQQHRLYVHSSFMENCPFALIEAFRAGLPVIAPAVGGIPEVLGAEGAGRYWDLEDADAGATVLSDMLEDRSALAEAGRRARARFDKAFSARVVGERLARFLEDVRSCG